MKYLQSQFARTVFISAAALLIAVGVAQAATTISTNILTGGTLGAYGVSTFGATASTTISAAGVLTSPSAIINGTLAAIGAVSFGATASTTFSAAGAVVIPSTLGVIGATSLFAATSIGATGTTTISAAGNLSTLLASTTVLSANIAYFGGSATTTISAAGVVAMPSTLTVGGTASTSALKVGDEPAAPTMNGMVFGYCSFADTTITASTTAGFVSCTTVPALALLAGDTVFVQATSSFDAPFVITAASTTGVSTIQLRIMNTGLGLADGTLGGTSVNFWALR